MAERMSDPRAWPTPFTVDESSSCDYIDLGEGHDVLAFADTDPRELVR
jgi:hypothetical protein